MKSIGSLVVAACLLLPLPSFGQRDIPGNPVEQFRELLTRLSKVSADDCGWTDEAPPMLSADTNDLEDKLLDRADAVVAAALNASDGSRDALLVSKEALQQLQSVSDELNKSWPEERRFRYELLDIRPALLVNYHFRSRAMFAVFLRTERDWPKPHTVSWQAVGHDEERIEEHNADDHIHVYDLHRGPSKLPRFLSRSTHVSCGDGQTSIEYHAYDVHSEYGGRLEEIINRKGAVSGEVAGFPAIGKLTTAGPRVTLPYCWWSQVDTSVWATLCSVDTYDISGEHVRFEGTRTNRPDLETIAKVIEYAQARDFKAVRGYSASDQVARKMVQLIPPFVFADAVEYKAPTGPREHIVLGSDPKYSFILEKRNKAWVVTNFSMQ